MCKNKNRDKLKRRKLKTYHKVNKLRSRSQNQSLNIHFKDFKELTIKIFKNYISNKIKKKARRARKRYRRKKGNRSSQNIWRSIKIIKNQRNKAYRKRRQNLNQNQLSKQVYMLFSKKEPNPKKSKLILRCRNKIII